MNPWNKIACISALGACCSLAVWISSTNANQASQSSQPESSLLVKKPSAASNQNQDPVLPPPARPSKTDKDLFAPQRPAGQAAVHSELKPAQSPQLQPPTNSTVKRPFMQPAQPREPARGQLIAQAETMPAPESPPLPGPVVRDPNVHPAPPIKYDTDHDARKMYRSGQVQLVMVTQDPSDGCCYEIPLCIPACCTGEPKISGGKGLLGRGVVEYCWACGFRAKVKFRHVLGDVKVEYEGD